MSYREIILKSGDKVKVDPDDYDYLSRWKWKKHPQGYASRTSWKDGKWVTVLMHRLVNNTPDNLETDHINRDKLDNRKSNLRAVDHSVNERNKGISRRNTSGYKGVCWDKNRNKWMAKTKHNGKFINIGRYTDIKDAVAAYEDCVRCL